MSDDLDDDDLSQFYGVFYDEADEHLGAMESLLLGLDLATPDIEQLNAIFRAAHSIKGGAAVFGFQDITSLTHEMETVFDRVRKSELPLSTALVDSFLAAGDALKAMFAARRGQGDPVPEDDVEALCERLRAFLAPAAAPVVVNPEPVAAVAAPPSPSAEDVPASKPKKARKPRAAKAIAEPVDVAPVEATDDTPAPASAKVVAIETGAAVQPTASNATPDGDGEGYGFFVDPSTFPAATQDRPAAPPADAKPALKVAQKPAGGAGDESASIRVGIQKVDQLINLVGELVITQSMLAQAASDAEGPARDGLLAAIAQLERTTRDVQEAAMSMRMMPMSSVFSRFPRMVRDVAAKLGKEVDLVTVGEGTELDKSLIERIVDPLTHLVRNGLDHGIEPPDERVAKGKARRAQITMRAFHQGGAIVIEVADDGRGLARDRILSKARERGMAVSDSMSDGDVWQLIFEAGFSTAATVTDVSGRGVGMDVVRRNIQEMGGRVEIESVADVGTRMRIKLPLTLAILDGMSVRVADELFIIPLNYISESLQPTADTISTIGGRGEVMFARGEYVPVVSLAGALGYPYTPGQRDGIIVIVEAEAGKTALMVDALVGQHQVVIKSLETNYRKVVGISGATIMGDGRVAMILDVPYLVDMTNRPFEQAA